MPEREFRRDFCRLQACTTLLAALFGLLSAFGQDNPAWPDLKPAADRSPLAGTEQLDWQGDLAMRMVDGVDAFLDREIEAAMGKRDGGTREELARKLGITRDVRPQQNAVRYVSTSHEPYCQNTEFAVHEVRWGAFGAVEGVGLLLEPRIPVVADVIALPDADHEPEVICGIYPFRDRWVAPAFAAEMAAVGCRVLVPVLIDRSENAHGLSNREWLHRPAWELGRTLAGYEVQKILAAVDCLKSAPPSKSGKVAVVGWGEGGRLALYAAALDARIDGALLSGYFGPRARVWDEPADRSVFGLLRGHSDAEIAAEVSPRVLIVEHGLYPNYGFRLDERGVPERLDRGAAKPGKPGRLFLPTTEEVRAEAVLLETSAGFELNITNGAIGTATWKVLLDRLEVPVAGEPRPVPAPIAMKREAEARAHVEKRLAEQVRQIERHNAWALTDAERVRAELFKDVSYESVEKFEASMAPLREKFRTEVIGEFASLKELPAPNPRTRGYQEGEKTISYEVVLDVHEEVFAYGILTLPKDLALDGGERRPVVVCQHGLEGRPQDTVGEPGFQYYKAFATRLAERGFITFAPQNIYIGHDKFRILQFKANALGCTLFSIMVPQHRQITEWLGSLPFVDPERIAFYGLSYGGKSAMRIPPLVERYCLSICSADFNEWIWKNAATDPHSLRYSYANKGEYEIFEFDLGNTFNYHEMAALICPRPFMVERGHFDGVAPDETVAYEYAKVRHLYAARLGIGARTEIEWFVGPHTINGVGTFAFLHRHLDWPER